MEEGRKKKKSRWHVPSVVIWIIFAVVVVYCVITIVRQQTSINEQKNTQSELLQKQQELSEQISALQDKVEYMQTDDYVEERAREIGYRKPGDVEIRESPKPTDGQDDDSGDP